MTLKHIWVDLIVFFMEVGLNPIPSDSPLGYDYFGISGKPFSSCMALHTVFTQ